MPGGRSLCSWGRSGAGVLSAMAHQETVCTLNLEAGTDVSRPVRGGTQQQPAPAKAHFLLLWARGQHTSCRESDVNIFSFVVHSTSVATIQLCHCSTNSAKDYFDGGRGWMSVKLSFVHVWFTEPPSRWVTGV